jgi:phosphomannomutase
MAPKFGTSGLRGLVTELGDDLCGGYVTAFLGVVGPCTHLCIGRDLRPSSPRIAAAVAAAARAAGVAVRDFGEVPTPALAMIAGQMGAPAVMVTGSHIPADRNGLKFYSPTGEITKDEELAISARMAAAGARTPVVTRPLGASDPAAAAGYLARYVEFLGADALTGARIGVYQHSSVARDMLCDLIAALGGVPVALGRADHFIPVDTEAVPDEMRAALRAWASDRSLAAILSADGDADRPLLTDAAGAVIPGDVLGHLTARALGANVVVTPVSSNTMIERAQVFDRVIRTRIGSPFVIAGMDQALAAPCRPVGFEANGGFLLGFAARRDGHELAPLMTRDAVLPMLMPLIAAREAGLGLHDLLAGLPQRHTAADRLEGVATDRSLALVAALSGDADARAGFFDGHGPESGLDLTDGLRVSFQSGLILHLRPSGNAPELRCYAEADTEARAIAAMRDTLARAARRLT